MTTTSNLGEFILSQTDKWGPKAAFILKNNGGERRPVSFSEFNNHVLDFSTFLQNKYGSNTPRFKIGLWGENKPEWCALALAIWHAGGVLVPLMHIATEDEIKRIIAAARLDALFISSGVIKTHNVKTEALGVKDIYLMEFEKLKKITHISHASTTALSAAKVTSDDLAVLIFTSGTTGHPKGVMLTHGNLMANVLDTANVVPCGEKDRAISVLPLSHMFELVAGFVIVHIKGICISYPESLKPEDVLSEMRAHKATMMAAVPLLFEIMDRTIQERIAQLPAGLQRLLRKVEPLVRKFPFLGKIIFRKVHEVFGGHMRYFFTGGAKIDSDIIIRFRSLGIRMLQGYGLTETSPIISFTTDDSEKYTSVGRIVKTLSIKIDQPNSEGDGEICVKGPSVFKGYFENPEATREASKDGWFMTGDLGYLDSEGYLFITGRKKDMIVTPNGKNVYPEELEEILKTSTMFLEVSVLGLDSGRGESVHAVIVPASSSLVDSSKEKIWNEIKRLTANISEYKKIQGLTIAFVELPKTPTKKVKKHLLRNMIREGTLGGDGHAGSSDSAGSGAKTLLNKENERELWLSQKLSQITKKSDIWQEADLKQDLGIDSLTFMEVISQLESQWNVHIPDEEFEKIKLVKDLSVSLNRETSQSSRVSPNKNAAAKPFDFHKNNSLLMNFIRLTIHGLIIRPLLKIFFRYHVKNNSNLSETKKSFVFTPNHSSHFDLISILSSVPLSRLNKTYAVAAEDYFFNTWGKSLFVRVVFNAVPFDRMARVESGFKTCEEILKEGGNLVIFPEGTRAANGKLSRFKPGVGRLLAGQPYAAIPAFISGAYEIFPKGAHIPKLKPLSVHFGQPIEFHALKSDINSYQEIAASLHKSVETLIKSHF